MIELYNINDFIDYVFIDLDKAINNKYLINGELEVNFYIPTPLEETYRCFEQNDRINVAIKYKGLSKYIAFSYNFLKKCQKFKSCTLLSVELEYAYKEMKALHNKAIEGEVK